MEKDIQIDPRLENDGLMFHFAPAIGKLEVDKESNSYQFIHTMIDKMMRGYDDQNPEHIGFIGGRDIIEYSLISMLDSYEKYIGNVLMSDLMPYMRQSNSEDQLQQQDLSNLAAE